MSWPLSPAVEPEVTEDRLTLTVQTVCVMQMHQRNDGNIIISS